MGWNSLDEAECIACDLQVGICKSEGIVCASISNHDSIFSGIEDMDVFSILVGRQWQIFVVKFSPNLYMIFSC